MSFGKFLSFAGACAVLAAKSVALDFTPQETWRALEGVRIPVLLFSDPIGKIRYQPPGNWNYNGGGPVFTMYPPNTAEAFMKFCIIAHAPGVPEITAFPTQNLASWSQQSYVPADAQEVKLLDENPSPFTINGKPSREFVFTYQATGRQFQTSVAVLDWSAREHFAVITTARATDFKAVHDAGVSSLFSWNLRKTSESPVTAQRQ